MTLRQLVARVLNATGATALLESWIRLSHPDQAAILMYHRVGSPALVWPLYADVVGPSADRFEQQMAFLRAHCRVLDLEEYLARRDAGRPLPPRTVVVTVDDGYADCYTTIYPILKRQGVAATIFLPTGYLDCPSLFWWDRMAYMVSHSPRAELELSIPSPLRIALNGTASRRAAALALVDVAKAVSHDALGAFLQHVSERTGICPDEHLAQRDYLVTWEQVRAMASGGVRFGAHTVTHPILTRVDLQRARWEVRESKRRLEDELGRAVRTFCYPSGEAWAFGADHASLLREAGFQCALSTIEGFNDSRTDPFALRRLPVGADEDPHTLRAALTGALVGLGRLKARLVAARGRGD